MNNLNKIINRIKTTLKNLRKIIKDFLLKLKNKISTSKKEKIKKKSSLINDVIIAFILAMLVRSFLYEPFHIPSGSMKPGLIEGDFIFVSKFSYGYSRYSFPLGLPLFKERIFFRNKPQRGEVIVFRLPSNPKINYIKRLVGLPGDIIQVIDGVLYINKKAVQKNYIGQTLEYENNQESIVDQYEEMLNNNISFKTLDKTKFGIADNTQEFTVPNKYYFFMGDNRDNSIDSRFKETGFIPEENLVGKARIIFFSINDSFLKFWKFNKTIRFERIFEKIK